MKTFETPGRENTQSCVEIAVDRAAALEAPVVVSSYTGYTAQMLVEAIRNRNLGLSIIVVRGVFGFHEPNAFRMKDDVAQSLLSSGAKIVSATHVLSGAERSLSRKFSGVNPVEIMAHTLRILGQGTKVCVECSVMALDAGVLTEGNPVVALGGTGKGCDTCLLITPAHAHDILSTKIHEIYCKPYLH